MTPPPGRRGEGARSVISDDLPPERDDPRGAPTPSFAYQAIMDTRGMVERLSSQVERLIKDRENDRREYRDDINGLRSDMKESASKITAEHKEFRKEDFKPLKDDVDKLRLRWAWVTGIAAAVGAAASLIVGLIQKKLGI